MEGGDRVFRLNFTSEGVAKLRELVTEKLKESMGEYTDDTLVEYVIVLLKNGRRKEEAKNELDVFLGDDSDTFASWLWDHLGSNLDLYVQSPNIVPETKTTTEEQAGRNDSHQIKSGENEINNRTTPRNRHNQEWKGLVRDEVQVRSLKSSVVAHVNTENEAQLEVSLTKRSLSPRPIIHKKRRRPEERQRKKEEVSQASVNAPRRLLQFAVRDAVATSRPSISTKEPSLKRLRSVVSASAGDSSFERGPQRIRSVAGVRATMSVAIKAAAEAVKDVAKIRSSSNVFDRLGRATDVADHVEEYSADVAEDGAFSDVMKDIHSTYLQSNESTRQHERNMLSFPSDRVVSSDLAYNSNSYDGNTIMDITRPGISGGNRGNHSLVVHYNAATNTDEIVGRLRKNQDQPATMPNTSQSNFSSSVKVNPWKLPKTHEVRKVSELDAQKLIQESNIVATKSGEKLMKESYNPIVSLNGNAKPDIVLEKKSLKQQTSIAGLHSSGAPREDSDSRTIFVSNVHFAATKDSVSRHFNKFGEVLKVIILTDPATGQPKGSAYIEFMKKEAAEHALSLDGTSFMSRILKIVRKSSAQPENASVMMTWPRVTRASSFGVPRFSRMPFARGIPSVYRARIPIKPGARSFQWKRDSQLIATDILGQTSNSSVPSPPTRSLTYVRTEPKTNGISGTVQIGKGIFVRARP